MSDKTPIRTTSVTGSSVSWVKFCVSLVPPTNDGNVALNVSLRLSTNSLEIRYESGLPLSMKMGLL